MDDSEQTPSTSSCGRPAGSLSPPLSRPAGSLSPPFSRRAGSLSPIAEESAEEAEAAASSTTPPADTSKDPFSMMHAVYGVTRHLEKWKAAHKRGYHIDLLTQDPTYKTFIMKHEVACKTSIPLPLVCIMELEAVAILQRTVKDYRHKLGAKHHLTVEVQQRIDDLQMRVSRKICNEEQQHAEARGGRKVREKIEKTLTKMKEERSEEWK